MFPNRQATYNRVHALLISWGQNDDLGTETEVEELKNLFENSYNFTAEKYIIPAASSEDRLEEKCIEVRRDHAGARDLLIVYYGGHGIFKGNKSIWHAWKNKPTTATIQRETSPELDWTEVHRSLMKAQGDILFILDYCYATFTTKIEPRGGTKELLAATSFRQTATGVHENSFTMAIIRELKRINKLPYTATMIHERLLNHYADYKIAVPQYVGLYRTTYAQSIVLAPQKTEEASETQVTAGGILVKQPMLMTDYRILISIALDNPYQPPDFTQWHDWFRKAAPRNIKDVKFSIEKYIRPEGAWESTSTLYLFSMPAALWNSMPFNPAYKMLAIIKSDNLLKPRYVSKSVQVQIESPRAVEGTSARVDFGFGVHSRCSSKIVGRDINAEADPPVSTPSKQYYSGRPTWGFPSRNKYDDTMNKKVGEIKSHRTSYSISVKTTQTKFYSSQIGGPTVVPQNCTVSPLKLLGQDISTAARLWDFLPSIIWPLPPLDSGPLCELYPSTSSIRCMYIHAVLSLMQLSFVVSVPLWIIYPVSFVIVWVAIFWVGNEFLCFLLNGTRATLHSNPVNAQQKVEHDHEKWIFLNGIGVGYASFPCLQSHLTDLIQITLATNGN